MHIPLPLKVWKLREPNVRQEFARAAAESKNEVFETNNLSVLTAIFQVNLG